MKTVLYISYTGITEPLGQSQVLPYLRELSSKHDIVLVTYENAADRSDTERFETLRDEVAAAGIEWIPLTYHRSPTLPATIYDLSVGFGVCTRVIRRYDIDIIHSRSYVPSVLALLCKRLFGTGFVFDMRGFWADERVDGGMWDDDSRIYRTAKWFEAQLLEQADVVISLTEAGIDAIEGFDHVDTSETRLEKIPTCVDLDLFTPQPEQLEEKFVLGYVGSVGTWYRFDDVLECFEILHEYRPNSRLHILNQGDHDYVYDCLDEFDIDRSDVLVKAVDHDEVPSEMNRMDAGIFFYTPTFSKKGTSPTKMGEFLACGLPCLTNSAVGDVESILEGNGVGIAIDTFDPEEKREAIQSVMELSADPATTAKCRAVAESYYSLDSGVEAYDKVYRSVTTDD